MTRWILAAAVCVASAFELAAGPAAGWRGDGTGLYPEAVPPVTWSKDTNIVWKTKLPNWSNASPIIEGDRLFVCSEPATLICLSLADGRILWQATNTYSDVLQPAELEQARLDEKKVGELRTQVQALEKQKNDVETKLKQATNDVALKQQAEQVKKDIGALQTQMKPLEKWLNPPAHGVNGYTSATPTSDGKRVYVLFGTGIAACYDMDGKRQWVVFIDKPTDGWGHSASPLLVGDMLIVHIRNVYGLDAATGKALWQVPSDARWGSPVHARIGDADVAVTANGDIIRVSDGKAIAKKLAGLAYCSPVVDGGAAYFIENGGKAVKLPDTADATNAPAILWETRPENDRYYASPVCRDGLIYAINQKQVWSVIDEATGKVLSSTNLNLGGTAYPSVALGGKRLYVSSDSGATVVLEPGREYKEVARNKLDGFRSTPVFLGKRMYVRTSTDLVCIGE